MKILQNFIYLTSAPDYKKAEEAAERILELLNRQPAIDNSSSEGDEIVSYYKSFATITFIALFLQPDFNGQIEFVNVRFIYPSRPESVVLKNFKLKINAGMPISYLHIYKY